MRATQLLHNFFKKSHLLIDKRITKTLFECADTLAHHCHLSIAGLGRTLSSPAKVKHCIKRIDRLFGNQTLHQQWRIYYKAITQQLVKGIKHPVILVDWSGLTKCGEYHFLRASIAVGGRAMTLYEEVHPLKYYTKEKVHRAFLKRLQTLLPKDCQPIIISDAGFRNPWFKQVRALGWDFIGRVRNKTLYTPVEKQTDWEAIKTVYCKATTCAKYVGEVLLAKSRPIHCHFYLMKQRQKNRVKRNLVGKKVACSSSLKHAKREAEPWLITSSLSPDDYTPRQIMMFYKKRMQIEEAFRDLKNTRNGFSLRHCRSYSQQRLQVALLIGAIATLFLWIVGTSIKQKGEHFSFQANTTKSSAVLSTFTIGWQALQRNEFTITQIDFGSAFQEVKACAA